MADIYLLPLQLSFAQDPDHWDIYFRKSLFKTSAPEFSPIADLMGVGSLFQFGDQE